MTASWKIFAFVGGVALTGAVAVACTVTTNSGGDGGLGDDDFGDSGSDTSTTSDTGAPDTGPACADIIYPDGGTSVLSLGTADCTSCTETSCCTALSACFQDITGDCQSLELDCLEPCVEADPNDAGGCANDCFSLHPNSANLHEAWSDCQNTNCSTQCQ